MALLNGAKISDSSEQESVYVGRMKITDLGYTIFDANIGYAKGAWPLSLQAENLLNAAWNEA